MMDERSVLLDEASGLYVGWYFWLRVLDEVNRSARYGTPFALLLLDVNATPGTPARELDDATATVRRIVRATDAAGRLGFDRLGVLLPHQDVTSAATARDRILAVLASQSARGITWDARLLCYPGDGAEISRLLAGPGERVAGAFPTPVEESA